MFPIFWYAKATVAPAKVMIDALHMGQPRTEVPPVRFAVIYNLMLSI